MRSFVNLTINTEGLEGVKLPPQKTVNAMLYICKTETTYMTAKQSKKRIFRERSGTYIYIVGIHYTYYYYNIIVMFVFVHTKLYAEEDGHYDLNLMNLSVSILVLVLQK